MKKVLVVFGTRPEAIKLCPVILELEKLRDKVRTIVCVTAQHRQMLDPFLSVFGVKPKYDLNLMRDDQTLFDITSRALVETGKVIGGEKPDTVIVQGDTTTTFVASLAAYYHKVRVAHVEAGLRTHNKYSPFPEELNRRLTGSIADIHFAPTEVCRRNLLREGIPEESIFITGNTVIDSLLWVRGKIDRENKTYEEVKDIDFNKKVILVTGHRRENFGEGFKNLCAALKRIAEENTEAEVVYPVHLNPNVMKPVYSSLSSVPNVKLLAPLNYEPFVFLMSRCWFIISDSGGIQEEAPALGKPVLVTRDTTERPEALDTGSVRLVGTDTEKLIKESSKLLRDQEYYSEMAKVRYPYGDGHASERIVEVLRGAL